MSFRYSHPVAFIYSVPCAVRRILFQDFLIYRVLQDLADDRPTVLDCQLDMDEFVLPMIPPGGSVKDLITTKEK